MASDLVGSAAAEVDEKVNSSEPDLDDFPDRSGHLQKRQARVTVKYNRKELQRRLDVEKWIDESMDKLYLGKEVDMPEEVNIDELIVLPNDEERVKKLQDLLQNCTNNTKKAHLLFYERFIEEKDFIQELVSKLEGLLKQNDLQSEGIEHLVVSHSHYRHEPYHFSNMHQQNQHSRSHNQTL